MSYDARLMRVEAQLRGGELLLPLLRPLASSALLVRPKNNCRTAGVLSTQKACNVSALMAALAATAQTGTTRVVMPQSGTFSASRVCPAAAGSEAVCREAAAGAKQCTMCGQSTTRLLQVLPALMVRVACAALQRPALSGVARGDARRSWCKRRARHFVVDAAVPCAQSPDAAAPKVPDLAQHGPPLDAVASGACAARATCLFAPRAC